MTVQTRAQLLADIALYLADNTTRDISEADLRNRFNDLVDSVGLSAEITMAGLLWGLTLSNNVSDANNDIDIAAGVAVDSTHAKAMNLAVSMTKRLDAGWAVGSGAGGLDTGTVAPSTTYFLWLIMRPDTGIVDVLFSASASAPTMPANYTYKRRIGAILRNAGNTNVAFKQYGDLFLRAVPSADVNNENNSGTSAALRTLTVPIGIQVEAVLSAVVLDDTASGFTFLLVTCPDQPDTAPTSGISSVVVDPPTGSGRGFGQSELRVMTDTSGRVRSRLSSSTTDHYLFLITKGWVDTRGRT